ncbi:MAG: DUF6316 family protein [Pseudomonadota bacterium]
MADSDKRASDTEKDQVRYFRTADRFARVDDQYWFATREGDEGPFATRELAEKALAAYIDSQQLLKSRDAEPVIERRRGDPRIWDRQIDVL